ncbi:MAG: hypothetical protein M1834_008948 [Cirrosporium novae-zelandiae]|nr:MAG: hypothetical protein M1834_008948 [Cirrosporium novae-zelandiae]
MLAGSARRAIRAVPRQAANITKPNTGAQPVRSLVTTPSVNSKEVSREELLEHLKRREQGGPLNVSSKEIPVITYNGQEIIKNGEVVVEPKKSTLFINDAVLAEALEKATSAAPAKQPSFGLTQEVLRQLPPTMQRFTLQGKVAVLTGAARGLGYNMAQALSEVGVKAIAIMDILPDVGAEAVAEIHEATGVPTSYFQVDVRDGNAITAAVDKIVETYGSVDVLVNSAGIADSNIKAEEYDSDMWRRLIEINVTGCFLSAQAVGRHMIKAGKGGSMIFIASMSGGVVNYPQEQSCYNASKAAVIQMGKSLAAEWAHHNIRVNCISPGYMDTELNRVPALEAQKKIWKDLTPQHRLGGVDELNNLAVFLASDASTFMTGANCIIDGGYSLY